MDVLDNLVAYNNIIMCFMLAVFFLGVIGGILLGKILWERVRT